MSYEPKVTLLEVQENPARIFGLGLTSLAWITHEAEYEEDDLTFILIQNEIDARQKEHASTLGIWRDEYMRLWPEHAKARSYD